MLRTLIEASSSACTTVGAFVNYQMSNFYFTFVLFLFESNLWGLIFPHLLYQNSLYVISECSTIHPSTTILLQVYSTPHLSTPVAGYLCEAITISGSHVGRSSRTRGLDTSVWPRVALCLMDCPLRESLRNEFFE